MNSGWTTHVSRSWLRDLCPWFSPSLPPRPSPLLPIFLSLPFPSLDVLLGVSYSFRWPLDILFVIWFVWTFVGLVFFLFMCKFILCELINALFCWYCMFNFVSCELSLVLFCRSCMFNFVSCELSLVLFCRSCMFNFVSCECSSVLFCWM